MKEEMDGVWSELGEGEMPSLVRLEGCTYLTAVIQEGEWYFLVFFSTFVCVWRKCLFTFCVAISLPSALFPKSPLLPKKYPSRNPDFKNPEANQFISTSPPPLLRPNSPPPTRRSLANSNLHQSPYKHHLPPPTRNSNFNRHALPYFPPAHALLTKSPKTIAARNSRIIS